MRRHDFQACSFSHSNSSPREWNQWWRRSKHTHVSSIEHDGPAAVQKDTFLKYELQRLRQHDLLDVASRLRHLFGPVAVIDGDDGLGEDGEQQTAVSLSTCCSRLPDQARDSVGARVGSGCTASR